MGDAFVLRFPRLVDFVVSADGSAVGAFPRPRTPRDTIRHLWLDQVLPLVLSLQGRIVLHASAVATPHGAVAFVGGSRAGKSTMAACLGVTGWRPLTDDGVMVTRRGERVMAVPSYSGVRLWPDIAERLAPAFRGSRAVAHYTDKRRFTRADALVPFATGARRLRRLYLLAPRGRAPRGGALLERMPRRDAVVSLVRFTFCLEPREPHRLADQFSQLSTYTSLVGVRRLSAPRAATRLLRVRDAILADLEDRR